MTLCLKKKTGRTWHNQQCNFMGREKGRKWGAPSGGVQAEMNERIQDRVLHQRQKGACAIINQSMNWKMHWPKLGLWDCVDKGA